MSNRRKLKKKVVGSSIDFGLIHAAIDEAIRAYLRLEEDARARGDLLRRGGQTFVQLGNVWLELNHRSMLQTARNYLYMAGADIALAVLDKAWEKIADEDDFAPTAPDAKWISAIRRAIDTESKEPHT